jgi:hypothetical protein
VSDEASEDICEHEVSASGSEARTNSEQRKKKRAPPVADEASGSICEQRSISSGQRRKTTIENRGRRSLIGLSPPAWVKDILTFRSHFSSWEMEYLENKNYRNILNGKT